MLDLAVLDDLVGHALDEVRRNREADADGAGGITGGRGGGDRRVDANHLAGGVERRAARVAGVDGRVDLHRVGDDVGAGVIGHGDRTVQRGHDAGGGGVVIAQRVADGHDVLADGELVGVGEFHSLQVARRVVELDDRQVGGGVGADHLSGVHLPVGQRHLNLLGAGDHVVVGDDVALGAHDRARPLGGAVAQRRLNRHDGAGDLARHGLPVGGLARLGGGAAGTGLVRLDVGQGCRRRRAHPTIGEREVSNAEAQRRGHQGGHHCGHDVAGRGASAARRVAAVFRLSHALILAAVRALRAERETVGRVAVLAILL